MRHGLLYVFAALGGIAGLTWELLWMHYTALSIGVSAQGAALTLVAFSLGMAGGAVAAGRWLARREVDLLRTWGLLEVGIGLLGQLLAPGFAWLAAWDASLFVSSPQLGPFAHGLGMLALLSLPSACMGATIPVFAAVARRQRVSLALMYASNIAGASLGIVLASFVLIPGGGIAATVGLASSLGLGLGLALLILAMRRRAAAPTPELDAPSSDPAQRISMPVATVIVATTGFATFCLEVAWFRSLRATFQATTESFALVLFAVLLALSLGSAIARRLHRSSRVSIGTVLALAAVVVLLTTPVIERLDRLSSSLGQVDSYAHYVLQRLGLGLAVLGPSMLLIGIGLPWCLEAASDVKRVGRLYAVNTCGAVVGSLAAAWLLLPAVGFARTAWIAAGVLAIAAWVSSKPQARIKAMAAVAVAGLVAWLGASEVGRLRVQTNRQVEHEVLETREGPDATVSVIEHADGSRHLVIDGFYATGTDAGAHYMPWMGHLPMLMHPDPKRALVICFGTGQTANAVLAEGPEQLDLVDVSANVFAMAGHFPENEGVIADPRVQTHVMDGRAWLRRTPHRYDVVTLEPMPPTFAGSNSLYSVEFYRLVAERLQPGGVVAQWLPFHLVDPEESAAITAAFVEVFPDAYLWIDSSGTGILVGRGAEREGAPLWPGLERPAKRDMSPAQIERALRYGPDVVHEYAQISEPVTDDNQLLAYGWGRMRWWGQGNDSEDTTRYQHMLLEAVAAPGPIEDKLEAFLARYPNPSSL